MTKWFVGLLAVVGVAATESLAAQAPGGEAALHPCDAQAGATRAVCRAGYDALSLIVPIGALAVTAGNPSLGTAAGGRGFADIGLTLRSGLLRAVVPTTTYQGITDTVPAARRLLVAVPTLEIRFGLIRRELPVGAVSLDFLGSVSGIPTGASDYFRFGPEVRRLGGVALGFGYGARIGMQPTGPLPAVSLNVGRRDLPAFSVGNLSAGSEFAYTVAVSAITTRLMVGKRFGWFEFTAGGGADLITGNYSLVYQRQDSSIASARADSSVSGMRLVTAANAAVVLGGVRVTFEGGFQVGRDEKLPTVFSAINPLSGRFFGGLGFGIKL